jgi:ferritin-like metal-binding protein YciE
LTWEGKSNVSVKSNELQGKKSRSIKMVLNKTNKKSKQTKATRTSRRNVSSTKTREITAGQKITLYLNELLAMENAAIERLQLRIKQTKIENVKERLRLHLEETREQQNRLKQLISDVGGKNPTKDKAQLPISLAPKTMAKMIGRMMTSAEFELKGAKEDAIIENAEIVLYDMLMHMVERMGITNAISVLSQSLSEEKAMADWIRTNAPDVLMQLWPEIEASIAKGEEGQSVETEK